MLIFVGVLLFILHGGIHLAGYAKSIYPDKVKSLNKPIGKITGLCWLTASFLFFISGILLSVQLDIWLIPAGAGILLSQYLILTHWKDARFGTVPNIVLLFVLIISFSDRQFKQMAEQETAQLLTHARIPEPGAVIVTEKDLSRLPLIVQRWLRQCGVVKQVIPFKVHISQSGRMRTSIDNDSWMPFTATQVNTVVSPGFIWYADVNMFAGIGFKGRDRLESGKGEMLIKFLSLIPVVNASGKEMDQGSMIRNLAEICWIPSMAIMPYVKWEQRDSLSAIATMTIQDMQVSGTFYFNQAGENTRFEAIRYYKRKEGATPEHWVVENDPKSNLVFNGVRVPTQSTITWKLKEGDFTWLHLKVEDITY